MTIDQFISKWRGKKVEVYDPTNKYQCVDLVLEFIKEQGHGDLIPLGIGNAYELWTKTPKKVLDHYVKVKNTLEAIPQAGDLIIWSSKYGPAGHTAIASGWAGQTQFEAFSQNDPEGAPCIIKRYNYNNIYGWLRLKSSEENDMTDLSKCLEAHKAAVDSATKWELEHEAAVDEIELMTKNMIDRDKKIAQLRQEVEAVKNKAKADLAKAGVDCQKKLDDKKSSYFIELETREARIKDLMNQIEDCEYEVEKPIKPREGLHKKLVDLLDALASYNG